MMHKTTRGFTIVELLIVIVVIGILAAIVIVAYNGVQTRAQQSYYKTTATMILKKAEVYRVSHGFYPVGASDGDQIDFITGDPTPDTAARLNSGIKVYYSDDQTAGYPVNANNRYDYNTIKSVADGTFGPGIPQKSYAGGQCGATTPNPLGTNGTGFKVIYPDPVTKQNVLLTTGTGC